MKCGDCGLGGGVGGCGEGHLLLGGHLSRRLDLGHSVRAQDLGRREVTFSPWTRDVAS